MDSVFLQQLVRDIADIKALLAAQHQTLLEHQRRSEAAEEALKLLRVEFEPVKLHVSIVGALGKVVGMAATLVTLLLGLAKLVRLW